ncbi:MAG: hypothetical protein ABI591_27575 [Kofleriaceae bacterium]
MDLGDTPSDIGACNPSKGIDYFISDIEPKYLKLPDPVNSCARNTMCHAGAHGLALSTTVGDDQINYRVAQGYLNCGSPVASQMLTFPMAGIDGHGGGDIFQMGSPEEATFLAWFAQ